MMTQGYLISGTGASSSFSFEDILQKVGDERLVFDLAADRLLFDLLDDLFRRAHGDVGRDEDLFELVVKFLASLFLANSRRSLVETPSRVFFRASLIFPNKLMIGSYYAMTVSLQRR